MATGYAWFLVLGSVFLCNLIKILLTSISSFVSRDLLKKYLASSFIKELYVKSRAIV